MHPILFKSEVIRRLRSELDAKGYIEFMTPVLRRYPGDPDRPRLALRDGAWLRESSAFALRYNLQYASCVFEIGPSFRPDDLDATHMPEFAMLDLYSRDSNIEDMLLLAKSLVCTAYAGEIINFSFANHLQCKMGINLFDDNESPNRLINALQEKYGDRSLSPLRLIDRYIIENIEPLSSQKCLIVTDFPLITETRARRRSGTAAVVERFEIIINGVEVVHGYTDEDDPEQFEIQSRERNSFGPEDEVMCSLMKKKQVPPASSGFAIGVDRLCQAALDEKDISIFASSRPFCIF